jgi:hypothetical protein
MLGVHKSATNITVLAELGLYPLSIAALKSSVIYWIRLLKTVTKPHYNIKGLVAHRH